MRILINTDTHEITTTPSALKFKGASFEPLELAFAPNGSTPALLPSDVVIEFAVTQAGAALAYTSAFSAASGNIYTGVLNCSGDALLAALASTSPLKCNTEVTWSYGGEKFRSATFVSNVEKPEIPNCASPTPNPALYPPPSAVVTAEMLAAALAEFVGGGSVPTTVLTPSVNYQLPPPSVAGTYAGQPMLYRVSPTADITFTVASGIKMPDGATGWIAAGHSRAMTSGKGYWVKLLWNGTAWELVSIEGGF